MPIPLFRYYHYSIHISIGILWLCRDFKNIFLLLCIAFFSLPYFLCTFTTNTLALGVNRIRFAVFYEKVVFV